MVESRRSIERHRLLGARSNIRKQFGLSTKPSETALSQKNVETKSRKIVLFDSNDEKDMINDSSSSNGSEIRTNVTYASFGRSSRLSARSNCSTGGTSTSSSSGTDSFSRPLRPSRSASTPAFSRDLRGGTRPSTSGMLPKTTSRAQVNSRNSIVSSEGVATPRLSSRGLKRRDRLKLRSDSMDSLDSDLHSPKELPPPQPFSPEIIALTEQGKVAWNQFSTHVKNIDDSSDIIARRPRKTFNSSGIFQKAMEDLYGSPEYWKSRGVMKFQHRVGAIATFASKFIVGARRVKALHESKGENASEEDMYLDCQPSQETVENAKRGWRILKQHVQEMAAEKRMSQTTLAWDMLRHTIKGISNMERARIDLYKRYGLMPMVKNDGTIVQENTMLSERARSAVVSNPQPSPTPRNGSRHSATTRKRSANRTYAPIEGFYGTGLKTSLF